MELHYEWVDTWQDFYVNEPFAGPAANLTEAEKANVLGGEAWFVTLFSRFFFSNVTSVCGEKPWMILIFSLAHGYELLGQLRNCIAPTIILSTQIGTLFVCSTCTQNTLLTLDFRDETDGIPMSLETKGISSNCNSCRLLSCVQRIMYIRVMYVLYVLLAYCGASVLPSGRFSISFSFPFVLSFESGFFHTKQFFSFVSSICKYFAFLQSIGLISTPIEFSPK